MHYFYGVMSRLDSLVFRVVATWFGIFNFPIVTVVAVAAGMHSQTSSCVNQWYFELAYCHAAILVPRFLILRRMA